MSSSQREIGWIKLHRKIWENPYMRRPAYLAIWIWILTHAEHGRRYDAIKHKWTDKDEASLKTILWRGKKRPIRKGEFTFGCYQIAAETGVPRGTVERVIKVLKSEEQIEVETTSKFSLGRVKNWEQYQDGEEQSEERMRNKRGADEEQVRTIKEYQEEENEKNEKNGESELALTPQTETRDFFSNISKQEQVISFFVEKGLPEEAARREINKFIAYWTEPNGTGRKERWQLEKTFEIRRRLLTWLSRVRTNKTQGAPKGINL